ncbi:MAG: heterodisulfide reductase-related iron-sulfur binding cluster [Anaerolineaceae bacterium]|nr:heterodisulfide reductase-related iron-sulfur binding cluster [Anaerolineaceae bacterium]
MPERIDFWGVPEPWGPILVYGLVTLSFLIMFVRFYRQASLWWRIGRPEKRWDQPFHRLGNVIKYSIAQVKILSQPYPGLMHLAIAGAYVIFFAGTALATINGHFYKFLIGTSYLWYKLVLDLMTLVFIVGAGMAAYRRFVHKPVRLTLEPRFTLSLALIVFIVINGLLVESFRLAIQQPAWAIWSPLGWGLAQIWMAVGASQPALHALHITLYFIHFLTVSALFIFIPTTTLVHIFTAPLNAFFTELDRPLGRLAPLAQNEKGEARFTRTLQDLTWVQLLESDTCTECGRCQDVCPAFAAGMELSPKQLEISLKTAFHRDGPKLNERPAPALVGDGLSDRVLWCCTTCAACDEACPVLIKHVDTIVDLRRYLVSEGRVDNLLQASLANLSRYGNAFGQSERARTKWTASLPVKIKDARREAVEYLWVLGDTAAYNPALIDITKTVAEVFQKVGIDFGLMYEAERNAGNDVRRVGEEGLFEFLVEKNVAALGKCDFKAIVTTDPHTYSTLKNEYPSNALAGRPVLHYTELLDMLVTGGHLKFTKALGLRVTYHDPCYLGRYNHVYDAPRRLLQAMGCQLVEMPRNRAGALCCAAGGGRIWMEEGEIKERPSEIRMKEAAALKGVTTFVVACPKDMIMYRDAIKTTGLEDRLMVKDMIELVSEALLTNR